MAKEQFVQKDGGRAPGPFKPQRKIEKKAQKKKIEDKERRRKIFLIDHSSLLRLT